MNDHLSPSARALLSSGRPAHFVTVASGAPHITLVWIALDGDDIVISHMAHKRKLDHLADEPRVSLSVQGDRDVTGIDEYLVIDGEAEVTRGLPQRLIEQLRHAYLGEPLPAVPSELVDPDGYVTRVKVRNVRGHGPWTNG